VNKTDKLAQELFDGDLEKAIIHILDTFETEPLNEYLMDFNKEQAGIFWGILGKRTAERVPEDVIKATVELVYDLASLEMEEDEVRNATVNPFGKIVLKKSCIILAIAIATPCLAYLVPGLNEASGAILSIGGLLTTSFALSIATNIISFFKFRKVKKAIQFLDTAKPEKTTPEQPM